MNRLIEDTFTLHTVYRVLVKQYFSFEKLLSFKIMKVRTIYQFVKIVNV